MQQFAVAFATTGNSPKAGHRFSEIVLLGQENGVPNGQRAIFTFGDAVGEGAVTFPAALTAMKVLVGDAQLIVHDPGRWRRFLRPELRVIKRHRAGHLMNNLLDVSAWAHQRFPRARKDVAAIARKAGVEVPKGLTGLELEAELLLRIANVMTPATELAVVTADPAVPVVMPSHTPSELPSAWVLRLGNFWRRLTGRTAG